MRTNNTRSSSTNHGTLWHNSIYLLAPNRIKGSNPNGTGQHLAQAFDKGRTRETPKGRGLFLLSYTRAYHKQVSQEITAISNQIRNQEWRIGKRWSSIEDGVSVECKLKTPAGKLPGEEGGWSGRIEECPEDISDGEIHKQEVNKTTMHDVTKSSYSITDKTKLTEDTNTNSEKRFINTVKEDSTWLLYYDGRMNG